jgi:hypothetical protein
MSVAGSRSGLMTVTVEPALAGGGSDGPDTSGIRPMDLPDHLPPLGPAAVAGHDLSGHYPGGGGHAKPLALAEGTAFPRQFAVLLAEALAGVRPVRQLTPWLSRRGRTHLHRLMPLFSGGHQPRVLRVLPTRPAPDVVEMTMIVVIGHRTRALAVRLEQGTRHGTGPERWLCTDIEAA